MQEEKNGSFIANDTAIPMRMNPHLSFADKNGAVIIVMENPNPQTYSMSGTKDEKGNTFMGKKEFYLGVLGIVISIIGSVWAVSSYVNNSVNDARKELQASINSNRQETLSAMMAFESRANERFSRFDYQFDKADLRIEKVESKIDESFKEANKNINEIKDIITKSK